ncbi:MAE_28990/MAE_18760 family HEPN-like nuclease [Bacillus spongiae]|uniref:MAE_28990/MAE_18760 family HEPN-like nuclease n=1 Tax=Bacillus spongiae TaxID=2683610 RepID=A0ABU8HGQ9_9BACI
MILKYSLIELNKGLEKIMVYIEGMKNHRELLLDIREHKKASGIINDPLIIKTQEILISHLQPDNKIFEYSSVIINLYGLLENYIENLIKEYLDYLSGCIPKYNNLPDAIKNNHYELSAGLINNLSLPKYKDKITKEIIINNLYSCGNCKGLKEYKINNDAFTQHTYNFKEQSINEFFKSVGLANITSLMKGNIVFREYLESEGIEIENAFHILNDLAERRNRISHGSEENDILDLDELYRYANYIKEFTNSLNTVLIEQALPFIIRNGDNIVKIGNPIARITDKIIGINIDNVKLSQGDTILFEKPEGKFGFGVVQSLQINNEEYEEVEPNGEEFQVGVCFDSKVKDTYTLYSFI